jgi:hypothetical protein
MNYVIYKGSGGLIHMLSGLVYCINYCLKYKNILIIDVISHLCYKQYLSDFFIINCPLLNYSEDYDTIEKGIIFNRLYSMDYIKNYHNIEVNIHTKDHKYLIDKMNIKYGLSIDNIKKKVKVYAGYGRHQFSSIINFIKVKPEIMNIIKEKESLNNYIGIHYRNTDIKNDLNNFINLIKNNKKYNNINNIYLATDDITAYDKFKCALPNHTIYQYTQPINSNGKPIHYTNNDKYNLVLNLLIDIYFLYNSNEFINSNQSLVSRLILIMRQEGKSIF